MSITAGTLEVELIASIARLQKDMGEANRVVGSAMSGIERSAATAMKALSALGLGISAMAFGSMVKGAIDAADAVNKLTQRTGMAAEALSQWQYAAKMADVSNESLSGGIKKLNIAIAQGLAGDKAKIDLFKSLGITTADLGKGTEAVMLQMADAFAAAKDGAGKTAVSVGLLGKAGDELIPLLNGGSQAVRDLMKEADLLGLTISTDFAKKAEEFNDNLTRLQTGSKNLAIALGVDVVDALGNVVQAMTDAKLAGAGGENSFASVVGKGIRIVIETIAVLGANLIYIFDRVKAEIGAVGAQIFALGRLDFKAFSAIGAAVKEDSIIARAELDKLEKRLMGIKDTFNDPRILGRVGSISEQTAGWRPDIKSPDENKGARAAKLVKELTEAEKDWEFHRNIRIAQLLKDTDDYLKANALYLKSLEDMAEAEAQLKRAREDSDREAESEIAKRLSAIQKEVREHGMLRSAIEEVTLAQMESAREGAYLAGEDIESLNRRIDLQKQLVAAVKGKELSEANEKGAREASEAWKQVGDSFVDNLMRGGKSVAEYLKDLFRTLVLRPILAPIGQAVSNIGASSGVGGTGSSMLSSVGTNMLGSAFGTSLTGTLGGTFGAGVAGGFGAGAVGGMELAGSLFSSGAYAGGAGAAVGALGPYALAAYAIYSMLTAGHGETRSGGTYDGTAFVEGPSGGEIGGDSARTAITATMQTINTTLKSLGSTSTLSGFLSGMESSEKGKGFAFAGGSLTSGATFGQYNRTLGVDNRRGDLTPEQATAAFGEELKQAMLEAIAASDAIGPLADYVRELGDVGLLTGEQLDTAINRINKALTEKQALEERLFNLTATDAEKLNRLRDAERAAIDATNLALLERVYAEEDLIAATAKAKEAADKAKDDADRAREAADARALETQRTHSQNALDEVNRTQGVLMDAYQRESAAKQEIVNRARAVATSLRQMRDAMFLGEDSPLSLAGRTRLASSQFEQTYAAGIGGDLAALEKVQGAGTAYLAALKESSPTRTDFNIGFARIAAAATLAAAKADSQVSAAEADLAIQRAQLSALGLLNTNFVSFADALKSYSGAKTAYVAATPGASAVESLYQSVLGRSGDMGGLAFYQGWLDRGLSLSDVQAAMQNSPEYMNGSHADGLWTVPFDGYRAELHEGERVLTSSQARMQDSLTEEVRMLRNEMRAMVGHGYETSKAVRELRDRGVYALNSPDGEVLDVAT